MRKSIGDFTEFRAVDYCEKKCLILFPSEKLIHNETQRLIENISEYVYDLMLQDVFLNRHRQKKLEEKDWEMWLH